MPTAGVVGLLPMVTYFFLVVTIFIFTGNLIFALTTQASIRLAFRFIHSLTAVVAAVTLFSGYLTQSAYEGMLTELATIADASDRQTLIRESYNSVGQYRYMDWFVTAPLLLIQLIFGLNLRVHDNKRSLAVLLIATSAMFFASFIGHQQLSFDNEIQVGAKVSWGVIATVIYGFIAFTLYRRRKQMDEHISPDKQRINRIASITIVTCWGVYLLGYFLTVADIDFNWIHIAFTLADITSKVSVGLLVYFVNRQSTEYS